MPDGSFPQELFLEPDRDPRRVGLRVGDLISVDGILGVHPETGQLGQGIDQQLDLAYANLRRVVERAGGATGQIARVSFFLRHAADTRSINRGWVDMFPDEQDRPTYKFMTAELPGDQLVQMDAIAVIGGKRRALQIPGVAHTNPIPMGVSIGNYLFSSRILPLDPEDGSPGQGVERQTELALHNMQALLEVGGFQISDVRQARAFVAERDYLPNLQARWNTVYPDPQTRPPLGSVRYRGAPSLLVFVEIIAAR